MSKALGASETGVLSCRSSDSVGYNRKFPKRKYFRFNTMRQPGRLQRKPNLFLTSSEGQPPSVAGTVHRMQVEVGRQTGVWAQPDYGIVAHPGGTRTT